MKPLSQQEYLIPVGNECCVPSMLEALRTFAEHDLLGLIKFGIAHTNQGDSVCWLLIPPEGPLRPLNAFENAITAPVNSFDEIAIDSYFIWRGKYYQFVADGDLLFAIKEVICFSTETCVYGFAQCKEYGEDVEVYAAKIYKIGNKHEYLFPAWYLQFQNNPSHQGLFIPMFMTDIEVMNNIDFNQLNWVFMEAGNTFLHEKELWKLNEDEENGLFINRIFFPFKIIKHSQ